MNKNLLLCLVLIGCFAQQNIVKEKKSIFISIFKNNTKEYGLSSFLNLAMIDEIMKDGRFIIENRDNAMLVLKGSIIGYKKTPIAWDKDMKITESRMEITIEYEVFDKESLIKKERLSSFIIYSHKDNEEEERIRLLRNLSRAVVKKLNDI